MNLVEDHPLQLADHLRPVVDHGAQNFRSHNQTKRVRVQLNVTSHQPDVVERQLKVAKLLIRQRLNRRRVDYT